MIQVGFCSDTTGSMSPCLAALRRKIEAAFTPLLKEIPDLEIALGANGDYCDARTSYVTQWLDFTSNLHSLTQFVRTVGPTGGGDLPECYELVLHEARRLSWSVNANKVLVLCADDVPHPPSYPGNTLRLNWRDEAKKLAEMGVVVYSVQCLSKHYADDFYRSLAEMTGGYHLSLDQFEEVVDLILAICYKQVGPMEFAKFEEQVASGNRMSRTLDRSFGILAGRKSSTRFNASPVGLEPVPPGRFQMLAVNGCGKISIRDFVQANDLIFKTGRGFYEFTKTETIQEGKEVVLRDRLTGDMYTGAKAREMIGLPVGVRGRLKPADLAKYSVFVQSTSYNRVLMPGTRFLYEVDLSR